jgi:hypothetical protein
MNLRTMRSIQQNGAAEPPAAGAARWPCRCCSRRGAMLAMLSLALCALAASAPLAHAAARPNLIFIMCVRRRSSSLAVLAPSLAARAGCQCAGPVRMAHCCATRVAQGGRPGLELGLQQPVADPSAHRRHPHGRCQVYAPFRLQVLLADAQLSSVRPVRRHPSCVV